MHETVFRAPGGHKTTKAYVKIVWSVQPLAQKLNRWEIVVRFSAGARYLNYLFLQECRPAELPIQSPTELRTVAPSPEVKRLGRKAHCLPPSSAQIHNQRNFTLCTPHAFGACIGSTLPLRYDRNADNYKNN